MDEQIAGTVGVVILGMGRSGTSAVSRMFAGAGFFAGLEADLMPANESNPAGHWEHMSIWRANEEVLNRLGASWFDPPQALSQRAASDWAIPMLRGAIGQILGQAGDWPIVVKDPRIGVMMPLWGPILSDHFHPVLVVRDPLEVALSLFSRDGTPVLFGLAAWQLHMTALLDQLEGQLVTVAPYARLVEDGKLASSVVEAAASHVDASRTTGIRPTNAAKALDSLLHRNHATPEEHRNYLSSFQLDLWHFLSRLPSGEQRLEIPLDLRVPNPATVTTVGSETERIARNLELDRLANELLFAEELVKRLTDDLAEEQQQGTMLLAELQAERARAEALAATHLQAQRQLESISQSVSWRITTPLRAFKASDQTK